MTSRELTVPEIEKLNRDQATTEREFWRKLRRHARRIPFADQLLAAYYCAVDPATPLRARAVLYGAIAYFILPIDVIPDWKTEAISPIPANALKCPVIRRLRG